MKSLDMFFKESDMENYLRAAYRECWDRLMNALLALTADELEKLSNPFLVKCLPAYRKAEKRVLFVGQETNGWDSFQTTLETLHGDRRDEIIDYLQWMYEDLRHYRKWDYTPFWKGIRRLYQGICPQDDDGFLHTELVRFDFDRKRPPLHIEELLQREYNVLHMEIKALSPDVVLFVTGPDYDDRIRASYMNVGKLGDNLKFKPIAGFNENALVRLSHPALPYHTYRTYHPNYSLQYKEKEVFIPVEKALKDLINK